MGVFLLLERLQSSFEIVAGTLFGKARGGASELGARRHRLARESQMRKRLTNALMALPTALLSVPALAQTSADRPDYWHYGWDWGWGHMIFGGLMMILFWGGIILVVVLAVRWLGGGSSQGAGSQLPGKRALEILQERFAKGEIDKEEFEERRRTLGE